MSDDRLTEADLATIRARAADGGVRPKSLMLSPRALDSLRALRAASAARMVTAQARSDRLRRGWQRWRWLARARAAEDYIRASRDWQAFERTIRG